MAQIATLSALERRVKDALEAFCLSKGAKPEEFSAAVFRRYYSGDLVGEVVTNYFDKMDWVERRKAVHEFLQQHLTPEEYREVDTVYFTPVGAHTTREERNDEGILRMEYSRI